LVTRGKILLCVLIYTGRSSLGLSIMLHTWLSVGGTEQDRFHSVYPTTSSPRCSWPIMVRHKCDGSA
jgi:hypothetical protein